MTEHPMTEATPLAPEQITQALDAIHQITNLSEPEVAEEPRFVLEMAQEAIAALSASPAPSGQGVSGEVERCLDALRHERENNSFARTATITDDTLDRVENILSRDLRTADTVEEVVRAYFERGFFACYAWVITKRGGAVLSDAVLDHAWEHRDEGMDTDDMLPVHAAPAPSCAPGEVERLANEAALRMWSAHPNDLDAKGFISNRHGGQYENPRAAYYASEIMAVVAAVLAPKESGE